MLPAGGADEMGFDTHSGVASQRPAEAQGFVIRMGQYRENFLLHLVFSPLFEVVWPHLCI
jgi:hypothetical protein